MYGFIYLFSLCRALRLAKRIDRSILKSIVTPSTGLPRQSQLRNDIVALSKDLILRYFPSFLSTPLCQGVRWEPGKRDLRGGRKGEKTRGGIFYPTICVMKSFGLYINSHCDYDAGFPLRSPLSETLLTKRMKRYLHSLQRPLRVPSTLFRV